MLKIELIILLCLSYFHAFSQVTVDTIKLYKTENELYKQWSGVWEVKYIEDKVKYVVNGKEVTEEEYILSEASRDSVENFYQGKYIIFHKNKVPTFECLWYFEGQYDGVYKQYDKKGRLRYMSYYDNGVEIDCGYVFDKKGKCKKAISINSKEQYCICPNKR